MQNDLGFDEDGVLVVIAHGRQTESVAAQTVAAISAAVAGRPPGSVLVLTILDDVDVFDDAALLAMQAALGQHSEPGSGPVKAAAFVGGGDSLRLLTRLTLAGPEFADPVRFFPTRSQARAWLLTRAAPSKQP